MNTSDLFDHLIGIPFKLGKNNYSTNTSNTEVIRSVNNDNLNSITIDFYDNVDKKSIEVEVGKNLLTVKGKFKTEDFCNRTTEFTNLHGEFKYSLYIHSNFNFEKVQAAWKESSLIVGLPPEEEELPKTKKIEIK